MRVISGSAKRLQLKTVEGLDTRPTTDRIKETLFNMIHPYLYDCAFLDLFSGSGAIGIEALSRGAEKAVFVENNGQAVQCIRQNLETTHLADHAEIIRSDVLTALSSLEAGNQVFDIIFMDPPYGQALEQKALEYLQHSKLVCQDTLVIVEASKETDFDYLENTRFQLIRKKEYKTNMHVFIHLRE